MAQNTNSQSVGNVPMLLSKKSQEAVINFYKQCTQTLQSSWNLRPGLEAIDRYYQREDDYTEAQWKAKLANRQGDKSKLQNVTVPIIMPQVESALAYLTSVFATGEPLFPVVASPKDQDAAIQFTAILSQQARVAGWRQNLIKHFRNGLKYNLAGMEVDWERTTAPKFSSSLNQKADVRQIVKECNVLRNMDMYNTFYDTRVLPTDISRYGEFAGYHRLFNRPAFKEFVNSLPSKMIANVVTAFESGGGTISLAGGTSGMQSVAADTYYVPWINPASFVTNQLAGGTDWNSWMTGQRAGEIKYSNSYQLTVLYGRIIPVDFDLRVPAEATPQVWKFYIVNNKVLIYAERVSIAHNLLPILFSQPLDDGLGYQTKPFAGNLSNMQDIASALWNAAIASRRRSISDRVLYDPSRIAAKDINSDAPAAKIPVRPTAYGKNIAESVFPFPYREDQAVANLQQAAEVVRMSDLISGQNRPFQGQFIKGNRTMHEYDDVMRHGSGRNQLMALTLEDQLMAPLKNLVALNILENQGPSSVFSPEQQQSVEVDPTRLREAVLQFKIGDGLIPTDTLIGADAFKAALQSMATMPGLGQGYEITKLFSYLMKTQGADLRPFEKSREQLQYEQQMGAWQEAAKLAAEKGTEFSTPMPQPPPPAEGSPEAQQAAAQQTQQTQQPQPNSSPAGA